MSTVSFTSIQSSRKTGGQVTTLYSTPREPVALRRDGGAVQKQARSPMHVLSLQAEAGC